jgi:hypothetical protein
LCRFDKEKFLQTTQGGERFQCARSQKPTEDISKPATTQPCGMKTMDTLFQQNAAEFPS